MIEHNGEKLYRLSRVAEASDLSLRTVQKHVKAGFLKVQKVGPFRRPRVSESELKRYLGEVKPDEE